jgi:hypothetical protein
MQAMAMRWLHRLSILVLSVALAACAGRTTQGDKVAIGAPSARTPQEDGTNGSETTLHVVATDSAFALDASQVRVEGDAQHGSCDLGMSRVLEGLPP